MKHDQDPWDVTRVVDYGPCDNTYRYLEVTFRNGQTYSGKGTLRSSMINLCTRVEMPGGPDFSVPPGFIEFFPGVKP